MKDVKSMKNTEIAEKVKSAIIKDLFADVDTQKCAIDIFLQNPKTFEKTANTLNKESISFLNKCHQQLKAESDNENILFFRKYGYEKILNAYLATIYKVETPEIDLFSSTKKLKNEEEKRRKETEEKKKKEREQQEREILAHIPDLSWKKSVGVNRTIYKATFYDKKEIELHVANSTKKKNTTTSYSLQYDKKQFSYIEFDGKNVVQSIEKTNPKVERNNRLVYVVNTNVARTKRKASKNIDPEVEKKQKEEIKRKKEERAKLKKEKKRQQKELLKAERIRQQEQQEQSRRSEDNRQTLLQQLPQIDVKDFLVRRSVFKCMHSKHQVTDITAAVRVVGDDGKAQLVKITAGYCEQCRVYFILESTYTRLRSMGVVLCRICDEKSFLKNSWINGMRLAQESILMQFGYTVSQEESLSASRRQKILAVMIDNKVLSKSEIISYLDFFINQRQYQSKFELAVSKWEMDRDFVQEYRTGEYTQFGVNAIYRK